MRSKPRRNTHSARQRTDTGLALEPKRMDLFFAERLRSEATYQRAVAAFAEILVDSRNHATACQDLIGGPPYVFEVVLSDAATCGLLGSFWASAFPEDPATFNDSIGATALGRVSLAVNTLAHNAGQDAFRASDNIYSRRRFVELASQALRVLSLIRCDEDIPNASENPPGSPSLPKTKRSRPGSPKQHRLNRRTRGDKLNEFSVFEEMGRSPPRDLGDAIALTQKLVAEQRALMTDYLEILCRKDIASLFKATYVGQCDNNTIEANDDLEDALPETTLAYPQVRGMKTSLHLDKAEDFGAWQIVISPDTEKKLRETKRKDPITFDVIMKKLRELSHGHFSADNQKSLFSHPRTVPIYEAKMFCNLRLVYQVDCIPDDTGFVDCQVLRVFGIYSHNQLNRTPWDTIGRQLAHHGDKYVRRCKFRNKPVVAGDYVVLPAEFGSDGESYSSTSIVEHTEKYEDLGKVHDLLVLGKFVTFSKAVLNSILADHEVAYVFPVSPTERCIIDHPGSCYVIGRSGTGKTTTMLFKILALERTWEVYPTLTVKPRQLFVTQSRMLANHMGDYFAKLASSYKVALLEPQQLVQLARSREQRRFRLVDEEDITQWRSDLPTRFSALRDEHFPLFLTYDHLCKLLEADVMEDANLTKTHGFKPGRDQSWVSYYSFLQDYWNHFPEKLTKGMDPALVYNEFIGTIQGSEEALSSEHGVMSKQTYLSLGTRGSACPPDQRDIIYDLFERYSKRKKQDNLYDAADRTRALLKYVDSIQFSSVHLDFVYVDEVQDNLLIDALVLRMLCRNPDGLFWAGDTAQTITVGNTFRFTDLRSLVHRKEVELRRQSPSLPMIKIPEMFALSVNYRSHMGIVNCARSVVQLITQFWPHTIDQLKEEEGIVDGPKPIFYTGHTLDTAHIEAEHSQLESDTGRIHFGAHQCILVRTKEAVERLKHIGLAMTVYECKGLEFDDVVVFNFFEDSPVSAARWRVVLSHAHGINEAAPAFDEVKHASLCHELKSLYVAMTRARKRLWLVDGSMQSIPVRQYLGSQELIEVATQDFNVKKFTAKSSLSEWVERAQDLFNHQRYQQARQAYKRAGYEREAAVAHAYALRQAARTMVTNTHRKEAYINAANAFMHCVPDSPDESAAYNYAAGQCYAQAGKDENAAKAFMAASEYTLAAQHFRKAGLFDELVKVMLGHRDHIMPDVAEELIDIARIYFLRSDSRETIAKATPLFGGNHDEQLQFAEDYNFHIAQVSTLEHKRDYHQAADVLKNEGRILDAAELLLKQTSDTTCIARGKDLLLLELWTRLSLTTGQALGEDDDKVVHALLGLAANVGSGSKDPKFLQEIAMFTAVFHRHQVALMEYARAFLDADDRPAALLCLDYAFSVPLELARADQVTVFNRLTLFHSYLALMRDLTYYSEALAGERSRRLLGFTLSQDGTSYNLPPNTPLYNHLQRRGGLTLQMSSSGALLSLDQAVRLITSALSDRIASRVMDESQECTHMLAFAPFCPHYLLRASCARGEGCRSQHVRPNMVTTWYTEHVRLHLQQILVVRQAQGRLKYRTGLRLKRLWLAKLHEALFPYHHIAGSPSNLHRGRISSQAPQVVKDWVREMIYELNPLELGDRFFTFFLQAVSLAFLFDGSHSQDYIMSAPFMKPLSPDSPFCRSPDGHNILVDGFLSVQALNNWSSIQGLRFIIHVLENRLPVDVGPLLDVLDDVCYRLSVTWRPSLHTLLLPRSWVVRMLERPATIGKRGFDSDIIQTLLNKLPSLLAAMATPLDDGWLWLADRRLVVVPFLTRQLLIARICKSISIIGYNTLAELQGAVLKTLKCLREQPGYRESFLYSGYANASDWFTIPGLITRSINAPLDEMIRLWFAPQANGKRPPTTLSVQNVEFSTAQDLRSALLPCIVKRPAETSLPRGSTMLLTGVNQGTTTVHTKGKATTVETTTSWTIEDASTLLQVRDDKTNSTGEIMPQQESADDPAETDELLVVERTSAEHAAATQIQQAYRKALKRVRAVKAGLAEQRHSFTVQCIREAYNMPWPASFSQYRLLYRGPLVHALTCAEYIFQKAYAAKQEMKHALMTADHHELEGLRTKHTDVNRIFHRALSIRQTLEPQLPADGRPKGKNEMHRKRDTKALRDQVIELREFMGQLPQPWVQNLWPDLCLAFQGIVEDHKRSKPVKPNLRRNDDGDDGELYD